MRAFRSSFPQWSNDRIVSKYIELQESTDKFIRLPGVKSWIWRLAMELEYAESGVLSDAEARDTVGKEKGPTIEALAIRGTAPKVIR